MAASIDPELEAAYRRALDALSDAGVPFVVGGSWAAEHFARLGRSPTDLDLMVPPAGVRRAADVLRDLGGYDKEETGLQRRMGLRTGAVDLVHHVAMGTYEVDEGWIARGVPARVFGASTRVAAPADLIWAKAFIAARDRFDGADIVHLLRGTAGQLDWERLLVAFRPYPELLLAYLHLFQFCYPALGGLIPDDVWRALLARARGVETAAGAGAFRGALLDRRFEEE